MVGNKGALLCQFSLYDKQMCFVNCHLESGAFKGRERLEMAANALKQVSTSKDKLEPDAIVDFSFFIGDTNSRFKTTYSEFIEHIEQAPQHIPLYDELHEALSLNHRFPGYHEEPISFMPTYKREDKVNDSYINKKEQAPSYCDRILAKCLDDKASLKYHTYDCRDQIFGSDHRPVFLDMSL